MQSNSRVSTSKNVQQQEVKTQRQNAFRKKRIEGKSCFSAKTMGDICGENAELALANWVGIVKELEYKIGQSSLLVHPDFAI